MDRSERDAQPNTVLIGGPERRAIVIAAYDPDWPAQFAAHRDRVHRALGPLTIRIEHIGSSAVPGLAAKPVIDVLVTVADPDDESVIVPAMTSAGYHLRVRETGHRMFRTPNRDAHLHVWGDSDPEVSRYLRFRDRLRASVKDRRAYEQLKRDLSAREWQDTNQYADAKSVLIEQILMRAEG
ncbi:MAG TPA: GrpB family protein [Solirubrobacteraceae bacterium]